MKLNENSLSSLRSKDQPASVSREHRLDNFLRVRSNPVLRMAAPFLLNGDRPARFQSLPSNLVVHDLARRIPYPDRSVDAVYGSHVLEHHDRDVVRKFIGECRRVCRPGRLIGVAVPDLERYCRNCHDHIVRCERGAA